MGHFHPERLAALARVECGGAGGIEIVDAAGELLYGGNAAGIALPCGWVELAAARGAALVFVATSPIRLVAEGDIEGAARAGHLVGAYATLTMAAGWGRGPHG